MNRRGFSIVELIVVITAMAILMVLGVVNLRSSQANGRDVERKTDIGNIAQHLENYYTSGSGAVMGSYPSTDLIGSETTYLPDIDPKNLKAPDQSDYSLVAATCGGECDETPEGVSPQPTIDQYVYQPIKIDGSGNAVLCNSTTDECRRFNLYYRQEVSTPECPNVNSICILKSRNQ